MAPTCVGNGHRHSITSHVQILPLCGFGNLANIPKWFGNVRRDGAAIFSIGRHDPRAEGIVSQLKEIS